jgi:hypothetical protein
MWSAHGACGYNRPLRVIPDSGKVSENDVDSSIKESCDIFHEHDPRSKRANEARELSPESGSFSVNSSAKTSMADVLAWESAADGIDADSVEIQSFCRELANVAVDGDAWPSASKDSLAVVLDFAEGNGSHAGSLEPETESANS